LNWFEAKNVISLGAVEGQKQQSKSGDQKNPTDSRRANMLTINLAILTSSAKLRFQKSPTNIF